MTEDLVSLFFRTTLDYAVIELDADAVVRR